MTQGVQQDEVATYLIEHLEGRYPEHSAALRSLCYRDGHFLLGESHPLIFCHLSGSVPSSDIFKDLSAAYVLTCAQFFLLDAAVDGHLDSVSLLVYLPVLQSPATAFLATGIRFCDPASQGRIWLLLERAAAQNASAMLAESRSLWDIDEATDRASIVGRSNCALAYYQIFCIVGGTAAEGRVLDMIEEFIVLVQESDDLSDWRDDLSSGRVTPFLRRIATRLGRPFEVERVESHLYLTGAYEKEVLSLIARVDGLLSTLEHESEERTASLRSILTRFRGSLVAGLAQMLTLKRAATADSSRQWIGT